MGQGIRAAFEGGRSYIRSLAWLVGTPRVWRHAVVPVLVAFVLFAAGLTLGLWGAVHLADFISPGDTTWTVLGNWALRIAAGMAAVVASFVVSLALAQPLSSAALETLASAQESDLGVVPRPRASGAFWRSLAVTFAALALGVPLLLVLGLVGVLFPPALVVTVPLKFLVSALMVAWDFLDYPFTARGFDVTERVRWMTQHRARAFGFGGVAAALVMVPGLGLLLLPVGAAGAARLVVEAESALVPRA